jgi:hypothetical protein
MAGSAAGMGGGGAGGVVSGGFLHKKKTVKDVLKPDKKATKKYAQRKRGY